MIENIKEKVKQAYQNDKLLYPLVDEMCEEINGTETDVENLEVTDLGSGNASAGKVATADGSGNVEWQNVPNELPSHGDGDVGKVLKVGDSGVEWGSAENKLYEHTFLWEGTAVRYSFALVSKKSSAYTQEELAAEIGDGFISVAGTCEYSSTGYVTYAGYVSGGSIKIRGARIADSSTIREWTYEVGGQYAHEYIREI